MSFLSDDEAALQVGTTAEDVRELRRLHPFLYAGSDICPRPGCGVALLGARVDVVMREVSCGDHRVSLRVLKSKEVIRER